MQKLRPILHAVEKSKTDVLLGLFKSIALDYDLAMATTVLPYPAQQIGFHPGAVSPKSTGRAVLQYSESSLFDGTLSCLGIPKLI